MAPWRTAPYHRLMPVARALGSRLLPAAASVVAPPRQLLAPLRAPTFDQWVRNKQPVAKLEAISRRALPARRTDPSKVQAPIVRAEGKPSVLLHPEPTAQVLQAGEAARAELGKMLGKLRAHFKTFQERDMSGEHGWARVGARAKAKKQKKMMRKLEAASQQRLVLDVYEHA